MDLRGKPSKAILLDPHSKYSYLYPQICVTSHPSSKRFLFALDGDHCRTTTSQNTEIMRCPTPENLATTQPMHWRFRDHCGRGIRETISVRRAGRLSPRNDRKATPMIPPQYGCRDKTQTVTTLLGVLTCKWQSSGRPCPRHRTAGS